GSFATLPRTSEENWILIFEVVEAGPPKLGKARQPLLLTHDCMRPGCGQRPRLSTRSHMCCPPDVVSPHSHPAQPPPHPGSSGPQRRTAAPHKFQTTSTAHAGVLAPATGPSPETTNISTVWIPVENRSVLIAVQPAARLSPVRACSPARPAPCGCRRPPRAAVPPSGPTR